ncbi:hypothetical protein [Bacillus atrophaeus]|uniref:hypothetical protein n=1 Tax=Bacillus atrophaeus TaxID=1452 RepID=UPI0030F39661
MNKAYADIYGLPPASLLFQADISLTGSRTVHTAVASFNLNSLIAQDAMDIISERREEAMDFRAAAGADIASRGLMAPDSAGRPGDTEGLGRFSVNKASEEPQKTCFIGHIR